MINKLLYSSTKHGYSLSKLMTILSQILVLVKDYSKSVTIPSQLTK